MLYDLSHKPSLTFSSLISSTLHGARPLQRQIIFFLPRVYIYIYTHPIWNQPSPHRKHQSSRTTAHLHTIIRSSNTAFPTPHHHHLSEPVITILGRHPYSSQPHHHNHHFWKPIAPLRLSPRSTTHLYLHGKQRHRRHPYATEQ